MRSYNGTFPEVLGFITSALANAPMVHVGEWQAIRSGLPQEDTIEVEDVSFETPIPRTRDALATAVEPSLPWAEEHFLERVSGRPWNPPPSHVRWPFAQQSNAQYVDEHKQFSHTYPERIWPRSLLPDGIRFPTGDLENLVELLQERSGTRQAYLPIWFPEDIAASQLGHRVPCTLGYHFLLRGGELKVVYYIRSCDFYRHFRDDVYMAARLCQWVADRVGAQPGRLVMHISSLHIFVSERMRIMREYNEWLTKKMQEEGGTWP